jgi:hypothetical protein
MQGGGATWGLNTAAAGDLNPRAQQRGCDEGPCTARRTTSAAARGAAARHDAIEVAQRCVRRPALSAFPSDDTRNRCSAARCTSPFALRRTPLPPPTRGALRCSLPPRYGGCTGAARGCSAQELHCTVTRVNVGQCDAAVHHNLEVGWDGLQEERGTRHGGPPLRRRRVGRTPLVEGRRWLRFRLGLPPLGFCLPDVPCRRPPARVRPPGTCVRP